MTGNSDSSIDAQDRALDVALARALTAPVVPGEFRAQLQAAIRHAEQYRSVTLAQLELERSERMAQIDAGYRRLRRTGLADLLAGVILAGIAAAVLIQWLVAAIGPGLQYWLPAFGWFVCVAFGAIVILQEWGLEMPFEPH
jgi:hypothetical protein